MSLMTSLSNLSTMFWIQAPDGHHHPESDQQIGFSLPLWRSLWPPSFSFSWAMDLPFLGYRFPNFQSVLVLHVPAEILSVVALRRTWKLVAHLCEFSVLQFTSSWLSKTAKSLTYFSASLFLLAVSVARILYYCPGSLPFLCWPPISIQCTCP